MSGLSYTPTQHDEWLAWRSFCCHFEELTGMDINHDRFTPMVEAIKRWGEELVLLRREHPISPEALFQQREAAPFHKDTEGTK